MTFRAVCFTENVQLKRTLRRSLLGAGSAVEFVPSAEALEERIAGGIEPDLIVLDGDGRRQVDLARLGLGRAQVIYVGESIEKDDVLSSLRAESLNHVISDTVDLDSDALVVTSGKVFMQARAERAGADIFGLEKYLAWGALVHDREVSTYDQKREALLEVASYASETGARRQVVARIESVTDELLMNALYDAPAARLGTESSSPLGHEDHPRPPEAAEPALLRYACDGRHLAVSVRDGYGELRKEAILDHIERARAMRGSPQLKPSGGAGLGLYFVIASVTRFIANISPGHATEVIGLFDIKAAGREQDACARSLHIFTAR
jgi:hypothetical protein